ncbi:MAG: ROK family protein [Chroococcidiopsidaceae cyanobacterium CP_BM_ER_R8_30]|nr:ROK family protein [Chroococcidiopsidaceae cyanobacterium CP_BM_ER_R8_30]
MTQENTIQTLAVDIGGSGIKVMILDQNGHPQTERSCVETPRPANPTAVIAAIVELAAGQGNFDRVTVGFPGVVHNGITKTAVNLSPDWVGFDLATKLFHLLGKLVRVANDADIQGYAAISEHGVELQNLRATTRAGDIR